jgi:hypothetical protein
MSSDTSSSTSETSPKFLSKEWFLKNKILVGVVITVILVGAGVGIYFAVRTKSTSATSGGGSGGTGGSTDTGTRKDGKWSQWSTECVQQGNQWVKTRTCIEEGKNGGLLCSQIDGGKATQLCEPIPGGWRTPPDSDSVCKLEDGKWVKERFCDNPAPKYGGATCQGSNKVDCTPLAGDWRTPPDSDSVCKLENGKWVKERFCDNPVPKYGATCQGSNKVDCTPSNGYWFPSANEAVCEVGKDDQGNVIVDGQGRTTYYKTLTCVAPQYGGAACPTRTESGVVVKNNKAMIPCPYRDGVWTDFSTCTVSGNDTLKTRTCALPEYGGRPCVDYYPLINLVDNNDSGYIASASSVDPLGGQAYQPYNAFDSSTTTYWHSMDSGTANTYNPTTGVYQGAIQTPVGSTVYRGEWIQIQFPPSTIHTPFRVVGMIIRPRGDPTNIWMVRSPRNFVLLGSQTGSTWTVIYDNTLLTGENDWKNEPKTIYFPSPASSGYTYYRLVITRVGNVDSGTNMKSVQIADLRLIGSPIIPSNSTTPITQRPETIPCNRDCLYGDWENKCEYKNNKWIQSRPKTDPVGAGASCDTTKLTQTCPTILTWNEDWGAFVRNGTGYGTGTPAEFVKGQSYTDGGVDKQVRYLKPSGAQGCPTNVAPDANGMCYNVRNKLTDWSECKIVNIPAGGGIANGGVWKQTRTNLQNNVVESKDCDPGSKWDKLPTDLFRIKIAGESTYFGFGGTCGTTWNDKSSCSGGYYAICDQGRDESGRQLWQTNAYGNTDRKVIFANPAVDSVKMGINYSSFPFNDISNANGGRKRLMLSTNGTDGSEYDPVSKRMRILYGNNDWCWQRVWGDCGVAQHRIVMAPCDINNPSQRFDIVNQSE